MMTDLDWQVRKPVWADSFRSRYHFRVEFGKLQKDGRRSLPDGTSPVATVQVNSWSMETAERRAVYVARSLYRDNKEVLKSEYGVRGYRMDE